jgi:hypothetical protein
MCANRTASVPVLFDPAWCLVAQVRAPVLGANLGTTVLRSRAGVGLEIGTVEIESEWTASDRETKTKRGSEREFFNPG